MSIKDFIQEQDPLVLVGIVAAVAVVLGVLYHLTASRVALDRTKWQAFALSAREQVNHNSYLFTFDLQSPSHTLGLPTGQHIYFKYQDDNGDTVMRAYTPISGESTKGKVVFLIKVYPDGKMGQHVANLKIGDTLLMKGPAGQIKYLGNSQFTISKKPRKYTKVCCIAGGSGITPMLQLMRDVDNHPGDKTQISLIYGNITEEDILCRDELEELAERKSAQVYLTLDKPPKKWDQGSGYVTKDMIEENCGFGPSEGGCILLCGPGPMVRALKRTLQDMGFSGNEIIEY